MKAFVMHEIGKVGFMEKPVPEPGPTDVLVKATSALVCSSDIHTLSGAIGERTNLTLGHEAVGVIEKLGSAVEGFEVGQRVAINAITPCYQCLNCQTGHTSQCTQALGGWKFANVKDGTFADYFVVNDAKANLALIPDELSDEHALYATDMMSTGFMGAENGNIPLGGTVAVFAQGPVGLMSTAGARLLGAGLIIAVESVPRRQELARHFGADIIIDPFSSQDSVAQILDLTEGRGVDTAIEALGAQVTFENCVKVTRPGGTISVVGYFGEGEYVNIPRIDWGVGMAGKTITTGLCPGGSERMNNLMRLIVNKRIDPTPLTTHKFSFDELETAFKLMETKEDGIIKPLITF
ncbi:Threonine dehydrogenase [Candidatus Syntrophocurvum alkaliphilum]|uniref:Threonine dehydrogenase n=1 Tax=Candidatus Syntrophocurvum alkaliphilum TaxID=2293317 RepID=A0A6I6DDP3_9FIRM|nr:NAD(P)-dependent alcohol dehydrogenase [Candidatus Syntrophocurvum alkaliphilum]QGU00622.1 Threonine dehydrogenase [Candidatus Syntrophocurvum alkaliphilum]